MKYEREKKFNENFINSLGINPDISQYVGKYNKDIGNDLTQYMTVWLKNVDRLMGLIPSDIKSEKYHICGVGCGLGVLTIYFKYIYKFKSSAGFAYNRDLINKAKLISEDLELEKLLNLNLKMRRKKYWN